MATQTRDDEPAATDDCGAVGGRARSTGASWWDDVRRRHSGRRVLRRVRPRQGATRRTVVYGPDSEATALAALLAGSPALGVNVVSTVAVASSQGPRQNGDGPGPGGERRNGHNSAPAVGTEPVEAVIGCLSSTGADAIAVADGTPPDAVRMLAWAAEQVDAEVLVTPAVAEDARHAVALDDASGLPLLRVRPCRLTKGRLVAKEVIDRVGSAVLLVVLSPAILATAAIIWLTSAGPVIYRQTRIGQFGHPFTFLKFRTMVDGADTLMPSCEAQSLPPTGETPRIHLADCNEADGLLFRLPVDPRVTRVGRVLRRYSVDELPQLWNVLHGQMSLVGPRPLAVSLDDFTGDARRRLRVKPGITGLWQVMGRRDLTWSDSVRLDLEYVETWSLLLDLKILARTPAAVLRGKGAY